MLGVSNWKLFITGKGYVSFPYLAFKMLMSIYMTATYIWSFTYRQLGTYSYGWKYFLYLSHWSYTLLVMWAILDFGLVFYRHNLQSRILLDPFWNQGSSLSVILLYHIELAWWEISLPQDNRLRNKLLWLMTTTAHPLAMSMTVSFYGFQYNSDDQLYQSLDPWPSLQEKFCEHNIHLIQVSMLFAKKWLQLKCTQITEFC